MATVLAMHTVLLFWNEWAFTIQLTAYVNRGEKWKMKNQYTDSMLPMTCYFLFSCKNAVSNLSFRSDVYAFASKY